MCGAKRLRSLRHGAQDGRVHARFAIVGGGVMGTSIALHLSKRCDPVEEPVVLFERSELAAGSSGRSGAILRCVYSDRELAAMARDSLREYASFQVHTGRPIGFRRSGVLTLAGPAEPEWMERVEEIAAMLGELAVEFELLDAAGVREIAPALSVSDETVGLFEPQGGFVDPRRTVRAFAALARTYGATTRLGVEVEGLRVEDGRVVGVDTSDGPVEAECTILVAGPWTGRLLASSGIELPLRVVRPENHFLAMPGTEQREVDEDRLEEITVDDPLERIAGRIEADAEAGPVITHPVLIDLELGFYSRCDPERGRVRVGRLDYADDREVTDPDSLDEDVPEEMRAWARAQLIRRVPQYAGQPDLEAEAAMYTLTPDAQAVIGPASGLDGLYVVSGFSGHGFKLAPSVGLGVCQMVFGDPVSAFDPAFFAPERWASLEGTAQTRPFGL
jgi:glycine/D-amino acid oxidase-like deaminating enzyme